MELNLENMRKYIRAEYERLTNENAFAIGINDRAESFYKLQSLRAIVRKFSVGDDLDRDLTAAMKRLVQWHIDHGQKWWEYVPV